MRKKFVSYDEKAVDKALEDIIKKLNIAMSKEDLMKALVNAELCRLLGSQIEQKCGKGKKTIQLARRFLREDRD
jgi:hypothetical protein